MTYTVIFHREAKKDLKNMHPQMSRRIVAAIGQLAENPKMGGSILLAGHINTYRYRVGDYRIVYRLLEREVEILILDAKPRGGVYNKY